MLSRPWREIKVCWLKAKEKGKLETEGGLAFMRRTHPSFHTTDVIQTAACFVPVSSRRSTFSHFFFFWIEHILLHYLQSFDL